MVGWRVLPVCALLCAVLLAACTPAGDGDDAGSAPQRQEAPTTAPSAPAATIEGGAAVVSLPHAPTTLHPWMAEPGSSTGLVTRPVLAPLWRIRPDGTSEPWLLAGEPEVQPATATTPFTVTYRIRDDAVWSDGAPIDGRDVLFTLATCQVTGRRDDCAAVDLQRSRADGRQATVAFTHPVADWTTVLATLPVLPEHALRGRPARSAWTQQIPVSSGPFRFVSWAPGERLVLARNARWWGDPPALDRIEFRFGAATVDDVTAGAVDVLALPASPPTVEQVRADPRVRSAVGPDGRWAALDFNLASPLVERRQVRRALARAIDRATIVEELVRPVAPDAEVLDELPGGPSVPADRDLGLPTHDARDAGTELDAAGCPLGDDRLRRCGGTSLRLRLVTDGGWQQTVLADYVRLQLGAIGVGVEIGGPEAATTAPDAWDLRVVAVPASTGARRWRCDDPANTQAFCDRAYDDLAERSAVTTDAAQRTELDAQAALLLASDLPTYPLYEMPGLLLHSAAVRGPALNGGPWGLTWNVDEWARTAA